MLTATATGMLVKSVLSARRKPIRLRRTPRALYPMSAEREYARALLARVEVLREASKDIPGVYEQVLQSQRLTYPEGARRDANIAAIEPLMREVNGIKVHYGNEYTVADDERDAQETADNVNEHNRRQVDKQFQTVLGVKPITEEAWLQGEIGRHVQANVDLISSIPERYHDEVKILVTNALSSGTNVRELTKQLRHRYNLTQNRARLIARDQVGKLNGQLTMLRQTEAGVDGYIWRTSMDERVRETHKAHRGKHYDWDKPPANTGHPGEDYQCRCTAEPDFDRFLDKLEEEHEPTKKPALKPVSKMSTEEVEKALKTEFNVTVNRDGTGLYMDDKWLGGKQGPKIRDQVGRTVLREMRRMDELMPGFLPKNKRVLLQRSPKDSSIQGRAQLPFSGNVFQIKGRIGKPTRKKWFSWRPGELPMAHTVRHELAHTVNYSAMGLRKAFEEQFGKSNWMLWKKWSRKNFSEYGATSFDEFWAEAVAMYTSPTYQKGTLPSSIEKWIDPKGKRFKESGNA